MHTSPAPSPWLLRWAHLLPAGAQVLDLACGRGRHLRWLADRGFRVTGIDRDPEAIAEASGRLHEAIEAGRFRAVLGNYADAALLLSGDTTYDAILLDLGVSSHQFDDERRGFSLFSIGSGPSCT